MPLESDSITHFALARRRKTVASGKVRVEFSHIAKTGIPLDAVIAKVGSRLRGHLVSARAGNGGKIPPATWEAMKDAVGDLHPVDLQTIRHLESLRDSANKPPNKRVPIAAQQRDATGLALDVFDRSTASGKGPPAVSPDSLRQEKSFLDGLEGTRTIEDQLIARDSMSFPNAEKVRITAVGAVFREGGRSLEVFNVNRTKIESSLGVDLLYWNERFDAWTLLQYKVLEREKAGGTATYRPDGKLHDALDKMRAFRKSHPDTYVGGSNPLVYRLCGDGFFFKFCSRVQIETLSDALLPGMYLPRVLLEASLNDEKTTGPRDGKIITMDSVGRHISNTTFADLVRGGWIGTRGVGSKVIAEVVRDSLSAGHALVVARERPEGENSNLNATRGELEF